MSLSEILEAAGIKSSSVIAGFAGAVASLVANKQLTFFQSVFTIAAGELTSGYVTPAVSEHFKMQRSTENMLAFFLGVIGMFLVVGVLRFMEDFSKSPVDALKNLLSLRYFWVNSSVQPKITQDETKPNP
jgi:uncharacterized membrane protein YeaQ/YmgE (transglycosylase-associated protein family)